LTKEELVAVEQLVNNMISAGADVETVETDIESAKKAGAMALFGEKYGKTVRMVKMGDLSTELCGGTHVKNTAEIGLFKIISESSVAAGVRRIEATTGLGVLQLLAEKEALIAETAKELKVQNPLDIAKKASALQSELKSANSENEALKAKIAAEKLSSITANKEEFCGIHLVMATVTDTAPDAVRNVCDNLRTDDSLSVALIAVVNGGKMNLIASCGWLVAAIMIALGAVLIVLWAKKRKVVALVFGIISAVLGIFGLLQALNILVDVPILTYGIPAVLSCYFDLFSGFVQAYVFSLLTMVYIAGSLPEPQAAEEK
jgi:alanyl-tRNA synthetase